MLIYKTAFAGYSVKDIAQAKHFYQDVLGLKVDDDPMGILHVETVGNQPFILYPKPDHQPAEFTVFNFIVGDIDHAVNDLSMRGVKFEHYDTEYVKTDENGIQRNTDHTYPGPAGIAWFRDPSGNILSIIQE